ncbi:MAG: MtrB/PioB family outer membrane beta-barrel protein [candidate division NC10 bacterium]|nr:MtrB/PioB family outer membrane beta-barrel protein [candidate division NC10 bacterium]
MGQARRWASVALSGLLAASLSLTAPGPARAASAGSDVLDWQVNGTVEAGGKLSFGERRSSKFNEYQDTDNGFVGELTLRGEKKDTPYFFDLRAKNPSRDDQGYEGAFGRYGLFHVELGWDRTPHVLSNSAQTIFQEGKRNGSAVFTLPSTLRSSIASTFGTTSKPNDIRDTINGLTRAVELSFNTDVGRVGFKYTPADEWAFDLEYSNLRRQGYKPVGTVIGSPGGSVTELAVPIENYTHEVKFGTEYARSDSGAARAGAVQPGPHVQPHGVVGPAPELPGQRDPGLQPAPAGRDVSHEYGERGSDFGGTERR